MNIAKRIFGGKRVFIIAEAGVNHNGKLGIARRMIDAAKYAGADAVKFQIFKAEDMATNNLKKARYQKVNTGKPGTQLEMLKALELKPAQFDRLSHYARRKGIIFLASPFDKESADLAERIGVSAFKIASGELTNLPLIKHIVQKGRPIIISCGMANIKEIKTAMNLIKKSGNVKIALLHCITNYPAQAKDVNLSAMKTLRDTFSVPVGFSDHTIGTTIAIAAAASGASILEKHFTLDKNFPGPDHKISLNPGELKQMISAIRNVEKARGDGIVRPANSEKEIMKSVRKSLVARTNIAKGARITSDMIAIKRPGIGIAPGCLNRVIGRRAKREIRRDSLIKFKDLK